MNQEFIHLDPDNVSHELLIAICDAADVIACECPGYLARLLRQVQSFRTYTLRCIEQFPEDTETHEWLSDRAMEAEKLLARTMIDLMNREGLIDDQNQVMLSKLSARAREIAMTQLGG
ncbi:MAG: hypothetical protein KME20_19200 [Kaiparowitsia implicata GSE-PSE-MK54-09C]|jgi:hypothetical protein|nr:hypothetical protein [Kaiparowitsia implicata GSE-PSE-MK54-09C]